jgi:hypothetical protein
MLSFKIKKLGNYWYPDVEHVPNQIYTFDEKLNKYLNVLNRNFQNEITLEFEEFDDILDYDDKQDIPNIIYFNDDDIARYMMTTEDFDLHYMINGHVFTISSDLYCLLEENFNFNFHKEVYNIHVY